MIIWFADKPGVRGLIGRDNWLFLCGDGNDVVSQLTGRQAISEAQLAQYQQVFMRRAETFEQLGMPHFFFIAPTKEVVYQDCLPIGYDVDITQSPAGRIMAAVEGCGVQTVYLKDPLIAARQSYGQVFCKTDTHWNVCGGYAAYRAIHQHISARFALTPPVQWHQLATRNIDGYQGDLANKPKAVLASVDPLQFIDVADDDVPPDINFETIMALRGNIPFQKMPVDDHLLVSTTREAIVHEIPDSTLPRAVVFRDSFAMAVMPFLSRHFSRIAYVWKPEPNFDIIRKERPDIVINLNLDRFLRAVPKQ